MYWKEKVFATVQVFGRLRSHSTGSSIATICNSKGRIRGSMEKVVYEWLGYLAVSINDFCRTWWFRNGGEELDDFMAKWDRYLENGLDVGI